MELLAVLGIVATAIFLVVKVPAIVQWFLYRD